MASNGDTGREGLSLGLGRPRQPSSPNHHGILAPLTNNLPVPGQLVRFREPVERFPVCLFQAGRTATVVSAGDDCIYARVTDMTHEETGPLAEWDGCVQWAGDDPAGEVETVAEWFWRECAPVAEG